MDESDSYESEGRFIEEEGDKSMSQVLEVMFSSSLQEKIQALHCSDADAELRIESHLRPSRRVTICFGMSLNCREMISSYLIAH